MEQFIARISYEKPKPDELEYGHKDTTGTPLFYSWSAFKPVERYKNMRRETQVLTFEYVHIDRKIASIEARDEIDKRGLRPALYEELVGFGLQYPDEILKHPIVALGSTMPCYADCLVGVLWFIHPLEARLHLAWHCGSWHPNCRFLAVRE